MGKRTIRSKPLYRSTVFELVQTENDIDSYIDKENRTITLSFSSNEPVDREFGQEILDHSDSAVDLSRLNVAGPLLVNHDRNDVVGVVESTFNDGERCSAVCRFGQSARAKEIFTDVCDGIRRTVSFGYRINKLTQQKRANANDPDVFIAEAWQPFEISLETIPADISVGVGRSAEDEKENEVVIEEYREADIEKTIPKVIVKENNTMPDNKPNERDLGIKAERKRLNGIRQIADSVRSRIPDVDALATEFMDSERTLDEFNAAIVAKIDSIEIAKVEARSGVEALGMSNNEIHRYSITRLVAALDSGDWRDASFELEWSRAYEEETGLKARGAFVPFDVLNSVRANETTSSNAGSLIATDYWGESFIDVLRKKSVVAGMGARMLTGLVGNVDIPKSSNQASYAWIAENANATRTAMAFETVALSPETIAAEAAITRKMLKQTANPTIDALIRSELSKGIVQFLDETALAGIGTGVIPSGITVAPDVNQVVGTGLTWASIVSAETMVATANADLGKLGYVCGPSVRGIAKTKVKDASGAGGFLMNPDGTLNGYNVGVTTAAGSNLIFGNWDDLIVAMWGGVDIELDKTTNGGSGGHILRAFLDADIAFRNQESFSVQKSIAG